MAKKKLKADTIERFASGVVRIGRYEADGSSEEVYVYAITSDIDADDIFAGSAEEARILRDLLIALDLGPR